MFIFIAFSRKKNAVARLVSGVRRHLVSPAKASELAIEIPLALTARMI